MSFSQLAKVYLLSKRNLREKRALKFLLTTKGGLFVLILIRLAPLATLLRGNIQFLWDCLYHD